MRPTTPTDPTRTTTATMRAVTQHRYGGTEQLTVRDDVAVPSPGPGEVLVRVAAAGVDQGVWHLMAGLPLVVRFGFGLRRPKQPVPGLALAGVVEAVGDDEAGSRFRVGDRVLGVGAGAYAELAVARTDKLVQAPADLDLTAAAALPISAATALQAVRDHGRAEPGRRVLVIGASGGVGSYAVQIAAAVGAHVTAVASGAKADLVRSLGADVVVDYRTTELTPQTTGGAFDLIVDIAGGRRLRHLRRLLTPTGTLVIVGAETGGRLTGGVQRQIGASILNAFVKQRLVMFLASEQADTLGRVVDLVTQGKVRPTHGGRYPLDRVGDAIDDLRAGRVRGKAVVVP
ncbi:MAG: NAD(P)-dependent alcohol dehydrogenase [Actinomycetales bacterium]|nr:NAD(P)-dependent alcohol dehydrogenase [Actinomycetales bacterium]